MHSKMRLCVLKYVRNICSHSKLSVVPRKSKLRRNPEKERGDESKPRENLHTALAGSGAAMCHFFRGLRSLAGAIGDGMVENVARRLLFKELPWALFHFLIKFALFRCLDAWFSFILDNPSIFENPLP